MILAATTAWAVLLWGTSAALGSRPLPCSLNGVPSAEAASRDAAGGARCICDSGWGGEQCERLQLGITAGRVRTNDSWTWGGSAIRAGDGRWHLFFSSMSDGCGLLHYQTNSVVRHAVSTNQTGPWRILDGAPSLSPRPQHWDSGAIHGPTVVKEPVSGRFLLYYMGVTIDRPRPDCRAHPDSMPLMNSSSRRIGLAWSHSIDEGRERWHRLGAGGQGSEAKAPYASGMIFAPRRAPAWDSSDVSNAAPLLLPNGTALLGYRAGGDGVALGGGIGLARAHSWNATYERFGPSQSGMLFSAEDGALYQDKRQHFHFLVHRFASGNGSTSGAQVGGHAYSTDGWTWHYSRHAAFNTTIRYGTRPREQRVLYRRERPKPVLDSSGRITHLWNGAWPCHVGAQGDDTQDLRAGCASFTMVTDVMA
jgi:hypothetical protein